MFELFGKSFKDILDLKTSFFDENEDLLKKGIEYARLYISQPYRNKCKICEAILPTSPSFIKHDVPYVICKKCTHLNGMHEDTDSYCKAVYTSDGGNEYAKNYSSKDVRAYNLRRDKIYVPKAEFLKNAINKWEGRGGDPSLFLKYADIGAGSGYFVSAMNELGFKNISGFEISNAQIEIGKKISPTIDLNKIDINDTISICSDISVDVLTFIGVFEHLQYPRDILKTIKDNRNVKYLYLTLPMFSPSVFFEIAFPNIFPRHLSIGHTHLFTDESISYLESEFDLERIGAWWFGTDMMDYYRSIMIIVNNCNENDKMTAFWSEIFSELVDEMQLAIDKQRKSSQVHIVFKVCH